MFGALEEGSLEPQEQGLEEEVVPQMGRRRVKVGGSRKEVPPRVVRMCRRSKRGWERAEGTLLLVDKTIREGTSVTDMLSMVSRGWILASVASPQLPLPKATSDIYLRRSWHQLL